jgi:hypothetical protein
MQLLVYHNITLSPSCSGYKEYFLPFILYDSLTVWKPVGSFLPKPKSTTRGFARVNFNFGMRKRLQASLNKPLLKRR